MSEIAITPFSNQIAILAELWMDYRETEAYKDLCEYGDLGFPLAYAFHNEIVQPTEIANKYIGELFDLLLATLKIEDTGEYEVLDDVFDEARRANNIE
jgi:hypothetical protein